MRLFPPGTQLTAELTEAMWIKYLAQGHNILLPGFEPSTSVSRNRHSRQTTNMLAGRSNKTNICGVSVLLSGHNILIQPGLKPLITVPKK